MIKCVIVIDARCKHEDLHVEYKFGLSRTKIADILFGDHVSRRFRDK